MIKQQDDASSPDLGTISWEDDGGSARDSSAHADLNSLLAREQTSIMHAEVAATDLAYDMHREASLHTRQLINQTTYPEHEPHIFARDRLEKAGDYERDIEALICAVEKNEQVLAQHFADGKVGSRSFQSRSQFLRQDRARLSATSCADHAAKVS